ncbi:MAG: trypsin-like peptidase domain-containing protein [Thermoanaerobaculaceae bacterium]|nr:trypsin-like peptidase domain-containing protein [Thermoanaerobaculaceae bacterium]
MDRRLVLPIVLLVSAPGVAQSLRRTPVVQVVERVRPAVVNLTARQVVTVRPRSIFDDLFPEFAPPGQRVMSQSLGSGVLISPGGLIVTNEHVIKGAAEIKVRYADGKEDEAEVIGSDADADLALLRVPAKGRSHLPVAEQDDSMIGETVIAIGNPLGLESTVTVGVLSARDRTVTSPSTRRVYTDFLQTDASINPGNSGGALVDLDGRLIGINTAIIGDAQGIGFAIPAKRVRRVVNDLLRYGQVQAAWLGVFVRSRGEGRRGGGAGVEVVEVFPGSPAAAAGLKRGAVLLAGGGRSLSSRDDYATLLAQLAPGDRVTLQVGESGQTREITVRATRPPEDVGEQVLLRFVGIKLVERGKSVVVSRVVQGSPAAEAGLAAGDVVLQVNGERVGSIAEIDRIVGRGYTRSSLLLAIQRGAYAYQLPFPLSS